MTLEIAHSCINCHFLVTHRIKTEKMEHRELMRSARSDMRDYLKTRNPSGWNLAGEGVRCSKMVWMDNDRMAPDLPGAAVPWKTLYEWIIDIDRGDKCFFYPFNEWMGLEAADVLQERQVKNRHDDQDRQLTREAIRRTEEAAKQTKVTAFATALLVLETFFLINKSFWFSAIFTILFAVLMWQFLPKSWRTKLEGYKTKMNL